MKLKICMAGNNTQLRVSCFVHRIHVGKDVSKMIEYFKIGSWNYIWREIIDSYGYVTKSI